MCELSYSIVGKSGPPESLTQLSKLPLSPLCAFFRLDVTKPRTFLGRVEALSRPFAVGLSADG